MILSRRRDTIMYVWYYHVCVILGITQTWYFIWGMFLTLKKMSARCALFRTLLIHTFLQQCVILKIVFSLKNESITSVWYYHVCVIVSRRRDLALTGLECPPTTFFSIFLWLSSFFVKCSSLRLSLARFSFQDEVTVWCYNYWLTDQISSGTASLPASRQLCSFNDVQGPHPDYPPNPVNKVCGVSPPPSFLLCSVPPYTWPQLI